MENHIYEPEDFPGGQVDCEYFVVGSGAGGSVAGALLAEAGKDVLFCEEGGYYPPESLTSRIGETMSLLYRNSGVFPFLGKPVIAFGEGCCVGGGTVINGGLIWRTPPWVLEQWRTEQGLSGYDPQSLSPWFEQVEKDLNVRTHQLEDDANLDSLRLYRGAEQLGWKCVLVPRAMGRSGGPGHPPPNGALESHQSTLVNYLPRAVARGARILARCKAKKIEYGGGSAHAVAGCNPRTGKRIRIRFKHLILAGGAVQTPFLLRRSGLAPLAGRKLAFHLNLKLVALFPETVFTEGDTIFTTQVQQFEREGQLMMASSLRPAFLGMTLAGHGAKAVNEVLARLPQAGIFAVMTRPGGKARIAPIPGAKDPLVIHALAHADFLDAIKALRRLVQLLFESGAERLYLPVPGSQPVHSIAEGESLLARLDPRQVDLITVHAMASCAMGADGSKSVTDLDGRLRGLDNVFITDASVLPGNIGESPQGTIMAFAMEIVRRHLDN